MTQTLRSISHRLRAGLFGPDEPSPKRAEVHAVELWYDRSSRNWVCYAVDKQGNEVSDIADDELSADYVGSRGGGNSCLIRKLKVFGIDPSENARRMRDIKQRRGY